MGKNVVEAGGAGTAGAAGEGAANTAAAEAWMSAATVADAGVEESADKGAERRKSVSAAMGAGKAARGARLNGGTWAFRCRKGTVRLRTEAEEECAGTKPDERRRAECCAKRRAGKRGGECGVLSDGEARRARTDGRCEKRRAVAVRTGVRGHAARLRARQGSEAAVFFRCAKRAERAQKAAG